MNFGTAKKTLHSLFTLLALCFLLASCTQENGGESSSPRPRVVSLLPSATELIFAVGAGEQVVGVTLNDNYPSEVTSLPKVGDQTIDLEKLVSLKPDLVVLDSSFNKDRDRLKQLGIPVLALECKRLADVAPAMKTLGQALWVEDTANLAAEEFLRNLDSIEPLAESSRVFIEVWSDPLMTAGSKTLLNDLCEKLGLKNCYADQDGYFQVDPEDVISRSPAVILWPRGQEQESASQAQKLMEKADREAKVIVVNPDLVVRPGPRLIEGLKFLHDSLQKTH